MLRTSLVLLTAFAGLAVTAPATPLGGAGHLGASTVSGVILQDSDASRTRTAADRPAITLIDLERRVGGEVAWFASLYSDCQGRVQFSDVPPGDYAVVAYWTQPFVNLASSSGLPRSASYSAEIGFKVEVGKDIDSLVFLVEDVGASAPPPAEDVRRPIPFVGSRSVADFTVPDVPSAPGLTHRILVPRDATHIFLGPLRAPSQTHAFRTDRLSCGEYPVTNGVAEVTPRFSLACPPGARIAIAIFYGDNRVAQAAITEPPIEWRLPQPGEGVRTVSVRIAPPNVGDGGLR